jgi:hypothetical protein
MDMEQELIGLALAIGRLTLALKQAEAQRDAFAAELAQRDNPKEDSS